MDAGDIYDTQNFSFKSKRKTSLYNQEVSYYGTKALLTATERYFSGDFVPTKLDYNNP